MTRVKLVVEPVVPRAGGAHADKPPRIRARWCIGDVTIYTSKYCAQSTEAERLAASWLARTNQLRQGAVSEPYEVAT